MASRRVLHLLTASRGISSTPHLASLGWINKIKDTFTGKKAADSPFPPSESFNLNSKYSPRFLVPPLLVQWVV